MLKLRTTCFGLLAAWTLVCPRSDAGATSLSEGDWQVPGDQALLKDAATGLEWLDLVQTAGMTYNQVSSSLQGGLYAGFRYASPEEVAGLLVHAGLPADGGGTGLGTPARHLMQLWGWPVAESGQVVFLTSKHDEGFPEQIWAGSVGADYNDAGFSYVHYTNYWVWQDGGALPDGRLFGSALVRSSPVPLPGSVLLLGSGLACLGAHRAKKRAMRGAGVG